MSLWDRRWTDKILMKPFMQCMLFVCYAMHLLCQTDIHLHKKSRMLCRWMMNRWCNALQSDTDTTELLVTRFTHYYVFKLVILFIFFFYIKKTTQQESEWHHFGWNFHFEMFYILTRFFQFLFIFYFIYLFLFFFSTSLVWIVNRTASHMLLLSHFNCK